MVRKLGPYKRMSEGLTRRANDAKRLGGGELSRFCIQNFDHQAFVICSSESLFLI
jgi:hypothetical protein